MYWTPPYWHYTTHYTTRYTTHTHTHTAVLLITLWQIIFFTTLHGNMCGFDKPRGRTQSTIIHGNTKFVNTFQSIVIIEPRHILNLYWDNVLDTHSFLYNFSFSTTNIIVIGTTFIISLNHHNFNLMFFKTSQDTTTQCTWVCASDPVTIFPSVRRAGITIFGSGFCSSGTK